MSHLTDQAQQLYAVLKEQLADIWQEPAPPYRNADAAAMLCQQALQSLKDVFACHPPRSPEENIHFFKTVKPPFVAELIYYNKLYLLHVLWPAGDEKIQKEYLRACLRQTACTFKSHKEFWIYYRTGRTDHDADYFIPGCRHAWQMPPGGYFDVTDAFTCGYDMIAGLLLACEHMQEHLLEKLWQIKHKEHSHGHTRGTRLPWTGSKVALVELLYSLHSRGAIGDGKIHLKNIVTVFQELFDIDLGNYSDVLMDIRCRKNNSTRFLDELKAALLKKLDEGL